MKRFTNENIQKERKKILRNILIGVLLLIIAFLFKIWQDQTLVQSDKNMKDLNTIILSKNNKENKKSYINAQSIPYKFAVYDDTSNSYYIVSDDKYMYIVYMSPFDFKSLNTESITTTPIKIEGITKSTTKDIKQLAIETYNEAVEKEEQLTLADFENYFGAVYLDMTSQDIVVAGVPMMLAWVSFLAGMIVILIYLIQLWCFSHGVSKLDGIQIDDLDKEMNASNAFYYASAHLYLTDHYIINFGGFFRVIKYEDILWMYPFEQHINGINTTRNLRILTKNGKTSTIANISIITKQKEEVYNEIWNSIIEKNNQMLTGYNKENIRAMKEKVKEIKQNK